MCFSTLEYFGFPIQRYICFRPYILPVVVGLCLGITVHMMLVPFLEEGCDVSALRQAAAMKRRSVKLPTKESSAIVSGDSEDFEARIIQVQPSNATVNKEAARPKLVRPRFISTELGIREKLFVAVFTSASTVDKLGVAIDKTLSKHVTKVIFFSSSKPLSIPTGLPMVTFNDQQPGSLPLHVLRYIAEHYADAFDYYMFLSERSYIRGEKLFDMIERISVTTDVYMGVPGPEKNFCAIEGGVIISQSVMSQVLGNIDWCMRNTHLDSPSISLGRCVQHATQKTCTTKAGDKVLKSYRLEDFDFDDDIGGLKMDPSFNDSLIFYQMPDDISHYKLHRYFCYVDLNETLQGIEDAKKDILHTSQFALGGTDGLIWPLGVPEPYKPTNRYSVIQWTYFTDTHQYLDNELTNIQPIIGADKLDMEDIKQTAMENLSQKYPARFTLRRLINGYRRFDPTRGMEYILDLLLVDDNDKSEVFKRVHLIRPLGKVEIVPMQYVTENMMVNIILPLHPEHVDLFDLYLSSYARVCLEGREDVRLIVALLYPAGQAQTNVKDPFSRPKTLISDYSRKYATQGKLTWKIITNYVSDINIMDLMLAEFQTDALILINTVNMEFANDLTSQYLNRVRMNTLKGTQVFFPMGFWQYKPNLIYKSKPYPPSVELGQRLGLFSTNSFEHCSFYTSDYRAARKILTPEQVPTGTIFSMFIAYQNLHIFRAVEPNLKLRWMNITCMPTLGSTAYQECLARNMDGLASQHHLALLIYEKQNDVLVQPENNPEQPAILHPPEPNFVQPQPRKKL